MEGHRPNEEEINREFNEQFGNIDTQQNLPNAVGALVLGIISTFFGLTWWYWIGSIISLVTGIIAIVLGKRVRRMYMENQAGFKRSSYNIAKTGKILGIIGVIVSSICLALLIALLIMVFVDPYAFKF